MASEQVPTVDLKDSTSFSFFPESGDPMDNWLQPTGLNFSIDNFEGYRLPTQKFIPDSGRFAQLEMLDSWGPEIDTLDSDFTLFPESCPISYHTPAPSACENANCLAIDIHGHAETQFAEEMASPKSEASPGSEKPRKRRRGRPRLERSDDDSNCSDSCKSHKSRIGKRQSHTDVERKYREGLNAELERLRSTIPSLQRRNSKALNGPPKPSKATVLATAIDYIKDIEIQRDQLLRENDVLKSRSILMSIGRGIRV